MHSLARLIVICGLLSSQVACASSNDAEHKMGVDLGRIPIGGVPNEGGIFASTDCRLLPRDLSDCSGIDAEGRRYVFFDGALSKVSVNEVDASKTLNLPAGLSFGDNLEQAAAKLEAFTGVKLDCGAGSDGSAVCSSEFVYTSSVGIKYSIELVGDRQRRLVEFIERTDF